MRNPKSVSEVMQVIFFDVIFCFRITTGEGKKTVPSGEAKIHLHPRQNSAASKTFQDSRAQAGYIKLL